MRMHLEPKSKHNFIPSGQRAERMVGEMGGEGNISVLQMYFSLSCELMFPHHSDQMSQRSQVSRVNI